MKLWSRDDYEDCNFLLVPHNLKSEFKEAIECEMFEKPLDNVWLLSSSVVEPADVELVSCLLTKVFDYSNLGNKIDFVEKINQYIKQGNISVISDTLKSVTKKSHIGSKILEALSELFYVHNFINDSILVSGPIECTSIDWVEDNLLFEKTIVNQINLTSYRHCYIKGEIIKNNEQLKQCIVIYNGLNPYKKLAFFASYFLFCCVNYMDKNDYSHATILLHRAVETIFISWLIQSQSVNLNVTKEGTKNDKAHIYLLGYMELVLKKRSLTEDEKSAVETLNKLRNFSKLAHGYKIVGKEELDCIFPILRALVLNETTCQEHYLRWETITQTSTDIYKIIYHYLKQNNYIEKCSY